MTMPPPPPPPSSPYQDPSAVAGGYGAPAPTAIAYATWVQRAIALLIDAIPAIVIGAVTSALGSGIISSVLSLASTAIALYFAYVSGETGQSPGKAVMGIQLVKGDTGQFIGGGMGIARYFVHLIDLLPCCVPVGYLAPLWDKKKQTFADKILNTVVIEGPKKDFATAFTSVLPGK